VNPRADQRLSELGLGGFPTTFFDAGYGEVLGGYSDTSVYVDEILSSGARPVSTGDIELTVEMNWLGGQGGPDDDIEITVTISALTGLSFSYPDGVPEIITPGEETTFGVDVAGAGLGVPVPGTGQLHYSINGGAFVSVDMMESLPNEYEATLPAINCGESIDFYLSAEEQTNGIMYDHDTSPYHTFPMDVIDTVFSDDFETDLGWSISGGQWTRGIPTGGGGEYGNPDPTSGHSDSNVLGYNLNGDYGHIIPEYHVTSPAIDCSGLENMKLRFWRWLGVDSSAYDHAYIRISTDGTSWTTVWENGGEVTDDSWAEQVYDISSYADDQATVYIRFTMGMTDDGRLYCGWNIDDIAVVGYACEEIGLTISTDALPDWTVEHLYSQALSCINAFGNVVWTDRDGDLVGTDLSLSTDGVVSGTPVSAGDISFVAQVTDETPATAERTFTFTINPAVDITTTSVPEGTKGEEYSSQFESSGGTGSMTWTDLNGDLAGSGLGLSESGLLSGIPATAGEISFTAVATDIAGASDQQALTIDVVAGYICGDASADGVTNITDAVYLVSYIFAGGPPPDPLAAGDVNCDGIPNITDAVYLITYIFTGGPPPCDPDNDGTPDC
jgi:hypothetical protein